MSKHPRDGKPLPTYRTICHFVVYGKARPQRSRFTRSGHVYLSKEAKSFRELVRAKAIEAMAGVVPWAGQALVTITEIRAVPTSWSKAKRQQALDGIVRPTGRPDCDNLAKNISDACFNGVVLLDDSQITDLGVTKWYGEQARTDIQVETEVHQ